MRNAAEKIINIIKSAAGKLKNRFVEKTASSVIISCIFVFAVIAVIIICSTGPEKGHVEGSALHLSSEYWKENDNGFKYYDKEGYESLFGIDVSEWVEDIDFRALKKSGVDFVIFRAGYRGYETGKFVLDNNLSKYLKQAHSAGLKMGAYFVSQAVNEEEAVEESRFVMDHVKGYNMEMPLYIDLEEVYDTARTDGLSANERTAVVRAFCEAVEEEGFRGGVYANEIWFTDKLKFDKIKRFDIWLARYSEVLDTELPVNMWQYSDQGVVEGTPMWVDLDTRISEVQTDLVK